MAKEITYVVFYCYDCNKINYALSGTGKCLICEGEIKYIKEFNNEQEADLYCGFLRKRFNLLSHEE